MTKKEKAAKNLHDQLNNAIDYQKAILKKNAELEKIWKFRADVEKPMVEDIRNAGIKISSIYDLVNTSNKYHEAIPVLIKYIRERIISEPIVKSGIIRALTVKEAKGLANKVLLDEYYKISSTKNFLDDDLKWTIGNAI